MTCFSCRAPKETLRCTGFARDGPSPATIGSGTSSPFRSPLYELDGLWVSFTEPGEKHKVHQTILLPPDGVSSGCTGQGEYAGLVGKIFFSKRMGKGPLT